MMGYGMKLPDQQTSIIRTVDMFHVKQIFLLMEKIDNINYTTKEFKIWWLKNFNDKFFRVWVEVDEEEKVVKSFMVANIVKPIIEDEIFIVSTYVDSNSNKGHEFMECVEGWARVLGVRKISAFVSRGTDGFVRKYGFKTGFVEIFKEL